MKRTANLVLAQSPRDPAVFDALEIVSTRCEQAGMGRLVLVRDFLVDAQSTRYEFALTAGPAQLWLHDDLDLELRYVSIHGGEPATRLLAVMLAQTVPVYSVDQIIQYVETQVHSRPEWLNALALASDSPAPPRVRRAVARQLMSQDEDVAIRAVEAAMLIGQNQFSEEFARLAASGTPVVIALLRGLGVGSAGG